MEITPLYDRVLLKRHEEKEVVKGGIIIPDTAREKPLEADVIAVGKGRIEGDKIIPLEIKAGDRVLIGKFSGTDVTVKDEEHVIVREEEILAKIS